MKVLITTVLTLVLIACVHKTPITPIAGNLDANLSVKDKWLVWKNKYVKGRSSNDGWLSLAGLYWLSAGKNTLGSAKDNMHQLPPEMPRYYGTINVDGDKLTFSGANTESERQTERLLKLNETEISYKNFKFYIIKREDRFAIRLQNLEHPNIAKYAGAKFYPYSNKAVISARLIQPEKPRTINIATAYGTIRESDFAGVLEFYLEEKKYKLEAVSYGKDSPMSLMFVDETGQDTTYGAGRYLSVNWPTEGDSTTIDFNYAYNPPCAITTFATCPLPPRQNRIDVAIEAGELFDEH